MLKVAQQCSLRMMTRNYTNDSIITEINQCGVITLNRPKVLNALNLEMIRTIYPKLKKWNENDKGTGDKAFCAGGDVTSLISAANKGDKTLGREFFYEEYRLNHFISTLKKPYIALIDGITMGGGVGLSIHGKYRIASGKSLFAMPETAIGLFPDVGAGYFLPRLKKKGLGLFLALTGQRLIGSDLLWSGISTHFTPTERMELLKETLVSIESSTQEEANTKVLDTLNDFHTTAGHVDPPIADQMDFIAKYFEIGDHPMDIGAVEKLLSNLKRLANEGDKWAETVVHTLQKQSPTSLKMAYSLLAYGAKMSLKEVLAMEYRLSQHCIEGKDFREGVRALLIDRDNKPKWVPRTLDEISSRELSNYFTTDAASDVKTWKP